MRENGAQGRLGNIQGELLAAAAAAKVGDIEQRLPQLQETVLRFFYLCWDQQTESPPPRLNREDHFLLLWDKFAKWEREREFKKCFDKNALKYFFPS